MTPTGPAQILQSFMSVQGAPNLTIDSCCSVAIGHVPCTYSLLLSLLLYLSICLSVSRHQETGHVASTQHTACGMYLQACASGMQLWELSSSRLITVGNCCSDTHQEVFDVGVSKLEHISEGSGTKAPPLLVLILHHSVLAMLYWLRSLGVRSPACVHRSICTHTQVTATSLSVPPSLPPTSVCFNLWHPASVHCIAWWAVPGRDGDCSSE